MITHERHQQRPTNRKWGPAVVMEIAEQRAPGGFRSIEDVISRRELEDISRTYKIEAGFDPETLNKRPSLSVPRATSEGSCQGAVHT